MANIINRFCIQQELFKMSTTSYLFSFDVIFKLFSIHVVFVKSNQNIVAAFKCKAVFDTTN